MRIKNREGGRERVREVGQRANEQAVERAVGESHPRQRGRTRGMREARARSGGTFARDGAIRALTARGLGRCRLSARCQDVDDEVGVGLGRGGLGSLLALLRANERRAGRGAAGPG